VNSVTLGWAVNRPASVPLRQADAARPLCSPRKRWLASPKPGDRRIGLKVCVHFAHRPAARQAFLVGAVPQLASARLHSSVLPNLAVHFDLTSGDIRVQVQ